MADLKKLQLELQNKLSISERSVSRRIKAREDETLHSRTVAALLVAAEAGLSLKRYATEDELAQVRAAQSGVNTAPTAPSSSTSPRSARRSRPSATAVRPGGRRKTREVMVVHGRDAKAKEAIFAFLRALDLKPLEWTTGIEMTGSANPTVQQIVNALFGKASAVVVLLTPDDEARLREPFHETNDPPHEVNLTPQARPNVLFEAGMAISSHPENTVMVQIGYVRPFTDIGGSFITHMNNSLPKRKELRTKLINAAAVDQDADDWRTVEKGGDFEYGREASGG